MFPVLQQLEKEDVECPQIPPAYAANKTVALFTFPALLRFIKLPLLAHPKIPIYSKVEDVR